ncbi:heterokaryon incompatibility protein [Colletotrichum karsti]|uniref:Heterokaryon incompatibility protein n=1 Tax=Colletotrichum karsti TaxID=1095194 RepID=A0A9P6LED5_9PEZI|nr:heterokaryon incompatibility protein [Colletotrichum karsti]KAF9870283.1 heterokaryon incompatibility protein [Colletotrichum karsti]
MSYVWDKPPWVMMTAVNLPQFCLEGKLRDAGLPKTITDAVRLTEEMGIPYLWVDALCIIQEGDGGVDKARQIPKMDAVYGLAEVTIVQASGQDSKCPLLGFGDDSAPLRQIEAELKPGLRVGLQLTGFDDKQKASSTWIGRAWTFQEAVLSPRLLIFHNGQVTWECREAVWCEDMSTEPDNTPKPTEYTMENGVTIPLSAETPTFKPQFGSQMLPVEASQLQDNQQVLRSLPYVDFKGRRDHISRYEGAVQEYTSREMSYWSDKLNAFAGLGAFHERQMGTGLVFGLPSNQLDMALLWSAADGPSLDRLPEFPSWSWAGWKGAVRYLSQNPVSLSPTCNFWVVDKDTRASCDGKMLVKRLTQAWEAEDYIPHDRPLQFSIKDGRRLVFNKTGRTVGGIALDEPLDATTGLVADMELVVLNLCTTGQRLNRPGEDYFPEFLFPNPDVNGVMVIAGKASRANEAAMDWCRFLLVKKKADGSVERKGVGDMTRAALDAAGVTQKMCFLT